MPITLRCACGKTLRVGDELAGKRVKCPVCEAIQTVSQSVAQPGNQPALPRPPVPAPVVHQAPVQESADYDVEFLDDSPEAEAKDATATASKPRMKAALVADKAPQPPPPSAALPKPRKKKKRTKAAPQEEEDDWYQNLRDREERLKRIVRGWAYIVVGVLICIGVGVIFSVYWEDVQWLKNPRAKLGIITFGIFGIAAIGKGTIGLLFGEFIGDED